MRLLDRVVSQQDFQIQHESLGKAFLVQTAANFKSKLQNTVHRFVLDAPATAFCTDFAVLEAKTLSESIDLLRLPAEVFWIEWMDRARVEALGSHGPSFQGLDALATNARSGALVELIPGERRGMAWLFTGYEADANLCPLYVEFDLDKPRAAPSTGPYLKRFKVSCREIPDLDLINRHCTLAVEPSWFDYCKAATADAARFNQTVSRLASQMMFDWPLIAAFTMLYQAPDLLDRRSSNLAKLNAARTKRGRSELLEHVEISASLRNGRKDASSEGRLGAPMAAGKRLHHVRGHFVRRGDSIFWRSPHLRGNASLGIIKTRTVQVTA
jgi:hypothetical protein